MQQIATECGARCVLDVSGAGRAATKANPQKKLKQKQGRIKMKLLKIAGLGVVGAAALAAGVAVANHHGSGHHGKRGAGLERMFDRADANRDNILTQDEVRNAAALRFASIDANNDGQISRDERRASRRAHLIPMAMGRLTVPSLKTAPINAAEIAQGMAVSVLRRSMMFRSVRSRSLRVLMRTVTA